MDTPHIPLALLEWLEQTYPLQPPKVPFTEQSIAYEAGKQAVITFLRLTLEQQQKESLTA